MDTGNKIFITGIRGYIGSALAGRLVREGYTVTGLDLPAPDGGRRLPDTVRVYEGDIRSKEIYPYFRGADIVFHLAGESSVKACEENPVRAADMNIAGAVNVFEAARAAQVRKVVYAGSGALYEGITVLPTPEIEVRPESFYAVSKLAQRLFARAYERRHGMVFTEAVYFNVYGPGQGDRGLVSKTVRRLLGNEPVRLNKGGAERRDYVHIDDVTNFNLLCVADERTNGNVYNVGSGKNYSAQEVFSKAKELIGAAAEPLLVPPEPGEALRNTLADIARARALGWAPTVDLETGLKEVIDYAKRHMS